MKIIDVCNIPKKNNLLLLWEVHFNAQLQFISVIISSSFVQTFILFIQIVWHSESESKWALLARYVYTYNEIVIVTEAPQCNRMTATGQDIDNKITTYK